jgi:hypothetical protein
MHTGEADMTTYGDLAGDEQRLLLASLQAAAVAISTASPGRSEETASEGFAAASFVLASRHAYVANPLVSSVILALEGRVRSGAPFPEYVNAAAAAGARDRALDTLRAAGTLLDARATPEEAAGYRHWLMGIANATAEAGKEDQGFLGRGGVRINEAERAALQEVAAVLGLDPSS